MGRWHADAARRAGGLVKVVVDDDPDRARMLAARYRTASPESRLTDALAAGDISVVHVCTPTVTHESLVREAIEAGCHVLVEKPLALTLAGTRGLLDLAADRDVMVCPMHQFIFQPGPLRIARLLPRLGTVRHVDLTTCSAGANGRPDLIRDQVAIDVLPHGFSLLARLLGSRFSEIAWQVAHPAPGELRVSGAAAGVSVSILVSMSGRPPVNLLRVVAERGSAHADLFHGFAVFEWGSERSGVSRIRKVIRPLSASTAHLVAALGNLARRTVARESAYPGLRELVRRFYVAVAGDGGSPISRAEILAVAAARDLVVQSGGVIGYRGTREAFDAGASVV